MLKPFWALSIAIAYTLLLVYATFMNPSKVPDLELSNQDKLYHVIAYLGLTILWWLYVHTYKSNLKIWVLTFAFLFGVLLEVLQHKINPLRQFDMMDIVANTIGVLIGMFIAPKFKWLINL